MSDKTTTPAAILHRSALPFSLFAVVLAGLLLITRAFVLPELLSVEIAGSVRNVQELKTYYDALNEQLAKKQDQRNKLILPMEGTNYQNLTDWKQEQYSLQFLLSSISQTAKSVQGLEGQPAVYMQSLRYFPIDNVMEITGDVRNVGPRSMTVLAQFVEKIQSQPFVENVQHPTFSRKEDSRVGFHSPFRLTVSLQ